MTLQAAGNSSVFPDETMIEEEAQVSLGIACPGCGMDSWEFAWYEQVGVGGTTYRIYYKCTNCGGMTFVIMHAR